MKLEKLHIENEAGEVAIVTRPEYVKAIVALFEVVAYTNDDITTAADKVVLHILKAIESGAEPDEGIQGEYGDLVLAIESDVKRTKDASLSKKQEAEEKANAKKAEKDAREEAEKKKADELKVTQDLFAARVSAGADLAAQEFTVEVQELIDSLPKGASVVNKNGGFGIEFAADATKETIGETLGYLMQKQDNSGFIANQLQFWVGDTIKLAVDRGIYATAKEAAKGISATLKETTGKVLELTSLDAYKRMAERTPIEYRNPKAQPTAYLAISQMKIPKKADDEKDEAFKVRLAEFEKNRENLQMKLATGEITDRKQILPLIEAVLIETGVKAKPSDEPVISISQQYQIFFHTTFALENFLDLHKEGFVLYRDGANIHEVSKEELEEKRASALANLTNTLYTSEKNGLKPDDYLRGYTKKEVMTEVGKDADGKAIMEPQPVKNLIYPQIWFQPEVAEAPAEAKA